MSGPARDPDTGQFTVFEDLRGNRAENQGFETDEGGVDFEFEEPEFGEDEGGEEDAAIVRDEEGGEEGGDTGGEAAGEDDDLRDIRNPKIRDRILRERNLAREAQRALQDERTQKQRLEAERNAATIDSVNARKVTAGIGMAKLKGDISTLTAELVAAKEAGETAKEVEIQGKLDETRANLRTIEGEAQRLDQWKPETPTKTADKTTAGAPTNDLAADWQRRNGWFNSNQEARLLAMATDQTLVKEGKLRPDTPEYFAELDKRMAKRFPELYPSRREQRQGDEDRSRRAGSRSPVAGVRPRGDGGDNPNRVTLSARDLASMKKFGLDPKNKVHLKAFAQERKRSR